MNEAPTAPFVQAQAEILGQDHSYPMIAYGTMKTSSAWKLYAKSQGIPFETSNAISGQIKRYELAVKHADEDEKNEIDIGKFISREYRDVFEKSSDYLGLISSWSIAPCSSLIYGGNIREEIGLVRIKDNICCLMDGKWAEEGHFLKNDHLKVSVVDLIYKAYQRIGREPPSVKELLKMCPPDDPAWDIFAKGCTLGINQCEQEGTRARVMKYQPRNISELSAFVAAIRPGGASFYKQFESREPFSYGVKSFDDLIQTKEYPYSFLLYQEQVMRALNYAGIDMAECYTAIKNIAKKRADKVLVYKEKFIDGFSSAIVRDEGRSKEAADLLANQLWKVIEDASGYSFNCVSGDTKLFRLSSTKGEFAPTIEEMYKIKHDKEYATGTGHLSLRSKYRRKRLGYGQSISMFDDGRIHPNRILDIRPAGEKQVYVLRTQNGRTLKCTLEHKILTPDGATELSNLSAGDKIYVCGPYEKDRTKYPLTDGDFKSNCPKPGERGFQTNANGASVVYNQSRMNHINDRAPCDCCGTCYDEAMRFELHHVDFDRTHNEESNFAWLCASCHKKTHYANGRRKWGEKGFPVEIDIVESIQPSRVTMTYDVEMADPAHNFGVESGIMVANCSHAYCVALDSLYGAWLKAHYPLAFYETYITLMEEKGDKDKINAAKEEAESYFGIRFAPMRFRQDNRSIHADDTSSVMINTVGSIKGYGVTIGKTLYECGKHSFNSFTDLLAAMDKKGIKEAKFKPLILIDYFSEFGNQRELLEIARAWDFFKQGNSKSVRRSLIDSNPALSEIVNKHTIPTLKSGEEAQCYTFQTPQDVMECLYECEAYIRKLHLDDLDARTKIQNSIDILGYCDVCTGISSDRRRLLITDVIPLKNNGDLWAYRLSTKSIGSGKSARVTVKTELYNNSPINKGDIVRVHDLYKNKAGYWYLTSYEVEQ